LSSFKSLDLFGSGPHRFSMSKRGELAVPAYVLGGTGSGSTVLGPIELDITITGRLVATSESALWSLRDAVIAQAGHPPSPGTLVDQHGRTWTGMTFLTYQEQDRTDCGRVVSIGYKAVFRKLA
jgi:hypothetical protein